jgi:hypothetical protein
MIRGRESDHELMPIRCHRRHDQSWPNDSSVSDPQFMNMRSIEFDVRANDCRW